jgi:hypothetical protein
VLGSSDETDGLELGISEGSKEGCADANEGSILGSSDGSIEGCAILPILSKVYTMEDCSWLLPLFLLPDLDDFLEDDPPLPPIFLLPHLDDPLLRSAEASRTDVGTSSRTEVGTGSISTRPCVGAGTGALLSQTFIQWLGGMKTMQSSSAPASTRASCGAVGVGEVVVGMIISCCIPPSS